LATPQTAAPQGLEPVSWQEGEVAERPVPLLAGPVSDGRRVRCR